MLKLRTRAQQVAAVVALLACGSGECAVGEPAPEVVGLPANLRPAGPQQLSRVNGVLMKVWPLTSTDDPETVRRALQPRWRADSPTTIGDWLVMSRRSAGRNVVVQLHAADGGGTRALWSETDLRQVPTTPAAPLLPLPRGTQLRSVTEEQDAGHVSIITGHTALAAASFVARLLPTARQRGWQVECAASLVTGGSCQFLRAAQWVRLQLSPDSAGTTLVLVQSGDGY